MSFLWGKDLNNFKITCRCGHYITKNDDLYRLSYYKVKTPTLKRTNRNERIIEEYFYCYVCPKCDRDVVVIKRKTINPVGNKKMLLPVKLIGLDAIEYLQQTENNRINKTNTLEYSEFGNYGKGIPLTYFKTLNSTVQRPRYLNEAGFSGDKIEIKVSSVAR